MLKLHHDINLFTVNVALNDDFEGGGLFYHKNEESYFSNGDVLPNFPQEKLNYDYLEQVTRQNTSYIVFPDAKTGSLLIHNYTLYHAIAPIEKGTRYSLIFFYDMHHPDVKRFYPEPFDVVVENSFDFPIDIYYLDNQSIERTLLLLMEDVTDKRFTFEGMPGQRYEVYASSGGDVIQIFEVYNDKVEGEEYIIRLGDEVGNLRRHTNGHAPTCHTSPSRSAHSLTLSLALPIQSQVLVIIKNDFPYPVSLHWWDDDDTDNPKVVLEEVLGRSHQMYSSVGHRFDIVQQDTGVVVDHFELDDARKGGSYFFHVGPQKKTTTTTEEKIPATIENNFPYPVSLYWIDHEEDNRPRFVLEEVLDKVHHMNTMSGHQFEVRKVDTEELVATFQVNETDSNEVIVIKIGPEPVDTVEGTTVETLPTSDLATNKDEL